jgi:hypothetical protein
VGADERMFDRRVFGNTLLYHGLGDRLTTFAYRVRVVRLQGLPLGIAR